MLGPWVAKHASSRVVLIKKISSFYNIGYRIKKSTAFQPMVSMNNNYFLFFSLPTLSSSSNGSAARAPQKLVISPQWRFHSFLVHWIKRRPVFFVRKPFLRFLLSLFINYVVMSAFCLRGKSFNGDRNHHQYTIGTALTPHVVDELFTRRIYAGYLCN